MSTSALPWLGWLLVAAGLWLGQITVGAYLSNRAARASLVRNLFTIAWALSALVGMIGFIKWVWQA
jgi:hypothetical protein